MSTLTSNERLSQIRDHDFPILLEFHSKHALGPLTRPSCLVCGKVPEQWPPAIQHAELPGIVVCHSCRDRATHETLAPSSNGNNALPVGAEDDPLLVWVLERYENCIRLAAQKKGQDRDGWLEDATHFQAVLKRLAAHGNETCDGLPVSQETKYTVTNGRLVNRASGKPIPDDEPVFILRAKDRVAVYAIMAYRAQCTGNPEHHDAVDARVGDFLRFKETHPQRMKSPDTTALKASEPHAWHFNRYRNGRLMAEGVTVHTATEAEAWEKAESLKRQFQLPTDELRLSQSEPEV